MNAILLLVAAVVAAQEKLVFFDDFNQFDLRTWKHEITLGGGGNWEFEWYLNNRSTSFVNNSILSIQPGLTSNILGASGVISGVDLNIWGNTPASICTSNAFFGCDRASNGANIINPTTSARIGTASSFTFRYGRFETRAKMPRGDWMWPAIWLLPAQEQYGLWPASGEIDIVESRGNDPSYGPGGVNTFGSTLHFGPYGGQDPFNLAHKEYTLPSGDFSTDFHVFGLIWNTTNIITYLDTPDNIVLNVPINKGFFDKGGWSPSTFNPWRGAGINAPFDQEFYIILNVAVGGVAGYFPDGIGGKPWSDTSSSAALDFIHAQDTWYKSWQGPNSAMEVDWVKVWQDSSTGATNTCICATAGCKTCPVQ